MAQQNLRSSRTAGQTILGSRLGEVVLQPAPDGGWTFEALAQRYLVVNDWLFHFSPGSGRKTIAERANRGRVKIHDGHPGNPSVSQTVGKILNAWEDNAGAWYKGFISSVHPEVATKLEERVITDNSLELYCIRTEAIEVDPADVPEHVRGFVQMAPSGRALVTNVLEWRWNAIGLVSKSSQDEPAIISPPVLGADRELSVSADLGWDEPIAARLASWAGEIAPKLRRGHLAMWYDKGGSEVFCGQIATLGEDRRLVVSRAALVPALEELEARIGESGLGEAEQETTLRAADRLVAEYLRRCRGSSCTTAEGLTSAAEADISTDDTGASQEVDAADAPTTEQAVQADQVTEGAAETDADAEPVDAAEPATEPLTAGEDATEAVANLQLRVLKSRIHVLKHRLGVAHEPAGPSRGLPAEGCPGP